MTDVARIRDHITATSPTDVPPSPYQIELVLAALQAPALRDVAESVLPPMRALSDVRSRLSRRPRAAGESVATGAAFADPMGRRRGRVSIETEYDYMDCYTYEVWRIDPKGDLISSSLGQGQHAPIFDVDLDMSVEVRADGTSVITATGDVPLDNFRSMKKALRRNAPAVSAGHLDQDEVERLRAQCKEILRMHRWHAVRCRVTPKRQPRVHTTLSVTINHPVRAVPSASNWHLYIDASMPFADSLSLAEAIGFVDLNHIAASRRSGLWVVKIAD